MIRLGILTSSRADYGIYRPLLTRLEKDVDIEFELIIFGTHLSTFHGYTVADIERDGYRTEIKIESMLLHDTPCAISSSFALTALKFADFWSNAGDQFDMVIAMGDRYEMCAAVYAGIPYNIKFVHLFGGESTLGAIDDIYRNAITCASSLHFTSTELYASRVKEITGSKYVYHVGSISLDGIRSFNFYQYQEWKETFKLNVSRKFILVTVHPETVDFHNNKKYLEEILYAFTLIVPEYDLIITMPNADTMGSYFRRQFQEFRSQYPAHIDLVENFGTKGYFSAMHFSEFMIGNTSSGIVEAASLKKYVINVGNRQKGRVTGANVIHVPFDAEHITRTVEKIRSLPAVNGENPYYKGGAVDSIIEKLKTFYEEL